MNKAIFFTSILSAILLTSCGDNSKEAITEKDNVVKPVSEVKKPVAKRSDNAVIVEQLLKREPSDNAGMLADSKLLVDGLKDDEIRDISNSLWAGTNGFERNRRASGALAVTAFEKSPENWSMLRSGISYVNGMGVNQNASKAINILSDLSLVDSSAAQFFLAKAYDLDGKSDLAINQFRKAANMGHRLAKQELIQRGQ